MDIQYLIIWSVLNGPINATVVTLIHPPREASKGSILEEFALSALEEQTLIHVDAIKCYSVEELANHVWCNGHTRELVIGGRAACLEACHSGWVIHI